MPTIMPEAENVQKAIKWISANIEENANQPLQKLIESAVLNLIYPPRILSF